LPLGYVQAALGLKNHEASQLELEDENHVACSTSIVTQFIKSGKTLYNTEQAAKIMPFPAMCHV
jgi:hypothetical protein